MRFSKQQNFFHYNLEDDNILSIIKEVKPQLIISCLRGSFEAQVTCHQQLVDYIKNFNCRLMYFSSANVFDAFASGFILLYLFLLFSLLIRSFSSAIWATNNPIYTDLSHGIILSNSVSE